MTLPEPESPAEPPAPPTREKKSPLRFIAWGLSTIILLAIAAPLVGIGALFAAGPLAAEKTVIVALGSSAGDIDRLLARENVIYTSPLFRVAARLMASNSLKAGEYAVPAHASPIEIATMIREGRSVARFFTAAEGLTSAEIVEALKNEPTLSGTVPAVPAEGSLLPETYRYTYGDSRTSLIVRMQKAMQEKVNELWATREKDLPLASVKEAVVLASVVEKETGKGEERPRIAGVFYNRLRINMRLQSDPTVIYAMTKGKGPLNRPLAHDDLSFNSPFNTYASDGLPPQPICNPGRAAIEAVLHPERNGFLYFVANGGGGHAFATDLAGHNQNINRWHQAMDAASAKP